MLSLPFSESKVSLFPRSVHKSGIDFEFMEKSKSFAGEMIIDDLVVIFRVYGGDLKNQSVNFVLA